jgi:hypothetical protein
MHLILSPFQQIDDCHYLVFWPSLLLFALDVRHRNIKGKKLVFRSKESRWKRDSFLLRDGALDLDSGEESESQQKESQGA